MKRRKCPQMWRIAYESHKEAQGIWNRYRAYDCVCGMIHRCKTPEVQPGEIRNTEGK